MKQRPKSRSKGWVCWREWRITNCNLVYPYHYTEGKPKYVYQVWGTERAGWTGGGVLGFHFSVLAEDDLDALSKAMTRVINTKNIAAAHVRVAIRHRDKRAKMFRLEEKHGKNNAMADLTFRQIVRLARTFKQTKLSNTTTKKGTSNAESISK